MSSRWFWIKQTQHVAVRRLRRHLQQQAFLQIAGADAGRIELLHDAQGRFDLLGGHRRAEALGDVLERERVEVLVVIGVAEVADLVDVGDDVADQVQLLVGDVDEGELSLR